MNKWLIAAFALILISCGSKQDKLLKELSATEQLLMPMRNYEHKLDSLKQKHGGAIDPEKLPAGVRESLIQEKEAAMKSLYSIPDSMARKLRNFAVEFPQNPRSEEFLYRATQLSEKSGRFYETANWCEDYVKNFPKGKYVFEAITAAGTNFERSGTFDKAILFYTRLYTDYPKSELATAAKKTVELLKKGLVTPEQQLDYLLQQKSKDSTAK